MLFQIKIINGQKTIVPLTADTGTGAPVGSLISMYKKSSPSGYLYCDGSTFDETAYPALYQYLGSNVLPDYREFALVGAEQNTTDVYNASTNPTGTIHDHDVYTEGQAKDDQLQNHNHDIPNNNTGNGQVGGGNTQGVTNTYNSISTYEVGSGGGFNARKGTVTRGKRKAVYFYIKATSGLTENQQENVLNTINENLSYSTTEHKTGKKYNGKDVYSKTIYVNNMADFPISTGITNVDEVLKITTTGKDLSNYYNIPYYTVSVGTSYYCSVYFHPDDGTLRYEGNMQMQKVICTIEYTKTTDN